MLLLALLGSGAAHAALLFGWTWSAAPPGGESGALQVALLTPQADAPAITAPAAVSNPAAPRHARRAAPTEPMRDAEAPEKNRNQPESDPPSDAYRPAPSVPAAVASTPADDRAIAARPEPPVPDAQSLRHRLDLAFGEHFAYPALARRRGWEGQVVLTLQFGTGGRLERVQVESSSGHDVLDDAALESARRIGRIPELAAAGATLRLPVDYRLTASR